MSSSLIDPVQDAMIEHIYGSLYTATGTIVAAAITTTTATTVAATVDRATAIAVTAAGGGGGDPGGWSPSQYLPLVQLPVPAPPGGPPQSPNPHHQPHQPQQEDGPPSHGGESPAGEETVGNIDTVIGGSSRHVNIRHHHCSRHRRPRYHLTDTRRLVTVKFTFIGPGRRREVPRTLGNWRWSQKHGKRRGRALLHGTRRHQPQRQGEPVLLQQETPASISPPSTAGTNSGDGETGAKGQGRGSGSEDEGSGTEDGGASTADGEAEDGEGTSGRTTAAPGTPPAAAHPTEDGTASGAQAPPGAGAPSDAGRVTSAKGTYTNASTGPSPQPTAGNLRHE
ncbi:uncharacterized protein [Procambarus clarkii]|uniref:uncharacterized protein n=1 Tax=Procambarus clarkii TaxID=6728 RepID=UPI003743E0E3